MVRVMGTEYYATFTVGSRRFRKRVPIIVWFAWAFFLFVGIPLTPAVITYAFGLDFWWSFLLAGVCLTLYWVFIVDWEMNDE